VNIIDQIKLYKSTNNVSNEQAQQAIAQFYAKYDCDKNSHTNAQISALKYTLWIRWFSSFEKAYIERRKPISK